ncbi:MAG: hypothetical protein DRR06_20335 [Gammaproteobacteria bacterium]|nr:MAG: hypothetical protein DRR06_20335 [Gammaproteobacteria bacterium]
MYFTLDEQRHIETGTGKLGLGEKLEAVITALLNHAAKVDADAGDTGGDADYEATLKAELGIE